MAAVTSSIVGIASGVMGATQSFKQAQAAGNASDKATQDSKRLLAEAKIMAEKNEYEALNIPMNAFERQREENTAAGSMAVQALQEGDSRGLAGGVGLVNQAQTVASETLRGDLGQALYDNNKMKAESRDNINQTLIANNVGQAKDLSAEANYQQQLQKSSRMSGVSSALGAVGSASNLVPLYGASVASKRSKKLFEANKDQFESRGIGVERGLSMFSNLDNKIIKDLNKSLKGGGKIDFDKLFGKGRDIGKGMKRYEGEEGYYN